jgi:hypothetical protein
MESLLSEFTTQINDGSFEESDIDSLLDLTSFFFDLSLEEISNSDIFNEFDELNISEIIAELNDSI